MNKIIYGILLFLPVLVISQSIPSDVKKTVAFIYAEDDKKELKPIGTGFFIAVTDTVSDSIKGAGYFVTSKHVLQKSKDLFLEKVYIRINKMDSLSETTFVALNTSGPNKNVYMHSDPTVDIAVIPAMPDGNVFDYKWMPDNFLTSKKDFELLKIKEGSDIFFTGMFTPYLGSKRNYPIVRFGRVALVTDEKIPWDGEMNDLYLVESSSYGGNSGSPVFFYFGVDRGDGNLIMGKPVLRLAGIMKGYFGESSPLHVVDTKKIIVSKRNIGIAAVVPSYLLQEILFSEELISKRGF